VSKTKRFVDEEERESKTIRTPKEHTGEKRRRKEEKKRRREERRSRVRAR